MNGSGTGRRRMGASSAAIPYPQSGRLASADGNSTVDRRFKSPEQVVQGGRVDGTQMRQRLLAALAASGEALSTTALARLAPWHVHSVRSGCASCHPQGEQTPWNVLECHGSWHVIERPRTGHDIHPHLQRLVADGMVRRSSADSGRQVYWTATVDSGAQLSAGLAFDKVAS
ncbi:MULTISPECIES: hypothetical protein [Mycolicibacter]|uniref:Uncharacterized protein n=2 Tax=Mycolicibacter TaxID=1073531 RepID=A0ABU5XQU4_9MYCO|nr:MULTISPECIES: hypothetical protein [unclassified Mycolicibacter]MEB3023456.1 hypothetical protein [Mycolicibacter sp. MYC098]MEB3033799.1 hypothetical protein [Mycolicibacter sp. MYC340]